MLTTAPPLLLQVQLNIVLAMIRALPSIMGTGVRSAHQEAHVRAKHRGRALLSLPGASAGAGAGGASASAGLVAVVLLATMLSAVVLVALLTRAHVATDRAPPLPCPARHTPGAGPRSS